MGGELLTIVGPCFDEDTTVNCTFGLHGQTTGVVSNKLRAYCPVPPISKNGQIDLTVSIKGSEYSHYLFAG